MNEAVRSKSRPLTGISRGKTPVALRHGGLEGAAPFPVRKGAGEVCPHFARGSCIPRRNGRGGRIRTGDHLNPIQVRPAPEEGAPDRYLGAARGTPEKELFSDPFLSPQKPPQHDLRRTKIDFWRPRRAVRWPCTRPRSVRGFWRLLRHTDFAFPSGAFQSALSVCAHVPRLRQADDRGA